MDGLTARKARMAFTPNFIITPAAARALVAIESERHALTRHPILPRVAASLRESARIAAAHASVRMAGGSITLSEAQKVIEGRFCPEAREEREVWNYFLALVRIERMAGSSGDIREEDIRALHGIALRGSAAPTLYRALTSSPLMEELMDWINGAVRAGAFPLPVIAAVAWFRILAICPFSRDSGKAASLTADLILQCGGSAFGGTVCPEERFLENPASYAAALPGMDGDPEGTESPDSTGFVELFCGALAHAALGIRARSKKVPLERLRAGDSETGVLEPLQRHALGLFDRKPVVRPGELSEHLGLTGRQVRDLCSRWRREGFLTAENASKRARSYRLSRPE